MNVIDLSERNELIAAARIPQCAEDSATRELRRARLRIAQLERSLAQTIHDSLVNFNRARQAERQLADLAR